MEINMDNKEEFGFFAMLDRMQYIERWALMRNSRTENIKEHSFDVAVIAHCLTILHNKCPFYPVNLNLVHSLIATHVIVFLAQSYDFIMILTTINRRISAATHAHPTLTFQLVFSARTVSSLFN